MASDRELKVVITAQDNASQAFREVQNQMGRIQNAASSLTGMLQGLGVALSAGAVIDFAKNVLDANEAMGKLAQKTGATTEFLSGFAYAAKQSDVSLETVQTGMKKLAVNMADASQGNAKAAAAFRALGVSVTDATGKLKPTEQVLLEIADKFAKTNDGAVKTALAVQLFGRSGSDMIPVLDQGSQSIHSLMKELDELGGTVTAEAARQAELFNEQLRRMKAEAAGVVEQFEKGLLPRVNDLIATERQFKSFGLFDFQQWGDLAGKALMAVEIGLKEAQLAALGLQIELNKIPALMSQTVSDYNEGLKTQEQILIGEIQTLRAVRDGLMTPRPKMMTDGGVGGKSDLSLAQPIAPTEMVQQLQTFQDMVNASDLVALPNLFKEMKKQIDDVLAIPAIIPQGWPDQVRDLQQQIETVFGNLGIKEEEIRQQVGQGVIDQATGAQRIIELHRQTGDELARIIPEYQKLAQVSGDPRLIQNAQELTVRIRGLRHEVDILALSFKEGFANNFADAVANVVSGTESLSQAFRHMGQAIVGELTKVIAKMFAVWLLGKVLGMFAGAAAGGGTSVGSDFGTLGAPLSGGLDFAAAGGASVSLGQIGLVGERGPELFVPSSSGTVLPMDSVGSRGSGGNIYVDARGADAGVEQRVLRATRKMQEMAEKNALLRMHDQRLRV